MTTVNGPEESGGLLIDVGENTDVELAEMTRVDYKLHTRELQ